MHHLPWDVSIVLNATKWGRSGWVSYRTNSRSLMWGNLVDRAGLGTRDDSCGRNRRIIICGVAEEGGGLSYELLIQDKMTAEINYFVKSNLWCVGCLERIEEMHLENEPCSFILHKKRR